MKPSSIKLGTIIFPVFFVFLGHAVLTQQQDVPEPVFMNFSVQPPYIPTYHGRDPFKPLDNVSRSSSISIAELDYHGTILLNKTIRVLFTWRGNPSVRYILKDRRLYSWNGKAVDGIVGDISDAEITLSQGEQKIVFPRK